MATLTWSIHYRRNKLVFQKKKEEKQKEEEGEKLSKSRVRNQNLARCSDTGL